mgnify:CR=1 FL=1
MVLSREELIEIVKSIPLLVFKTGDNLNEKIIARALSTYAEDCREDEIIAIGSSMLMDAVNRFIGEEADSDFLLTINSLYSSYFNRLSICGIRKVKQSKENFNQLNIFYQDGHLQTIGINDRRSKIAIQNLLINISKKERNKKNISSNSSRFINRNKKREETDTYENLYQTDEEKFELIDGQIEVHTQAVPEQEPPECVVYVLDQPTLF